MTDADSLYQRSMDELDRRRDLQLERLLLAMYASNVLPAKRAPLNEPQHLRFVALLLLLPEEGIELTRISKTTTLTAYLKQAVNTGLLDLEHIQLNWIRNSQTK